MIKVFIEDFTFSCIIGLLDFERVKPQKIVINAKFSSDEFIDYAKACAYIKDEFEKEKFLKVEDALIYFQKEFKHNFPSLKYFYMKISKPNILQNAIVGAEIEQLF